jgi:hypothetical protein
MKYAIELLKSELINERVDKAQANEWLQGSGISGKNRSDIEAFEESRRIAIERIPQLEKAINLLIF